jgi:hypothetical protein
MGIAPGNDLYALRSLIGANDTMAAVVAEIASQYGPPRNPIDVIRIECHGIEQYGGVFGMRFGQSMTASTVGAFTGVRTKWSRAYSARPLATALYNVIPRIECHGCAPVHRCNALLQALATAARAPLFASSKAQMVHGRGSGLDPFAFEGAVFRFVPGGTARPEQLP